MGRDEDKEKKRNRKSKEHKHKQSSSSESESKSEEEWVEASASSNDKRDEWMNVSSFIPTVSRSELKRRNKKENEPQSLTTIDKPGQHERELNPYWKDGGVGVPTESSGETSSKDRPSSEKTVGDAGLNWLRRAYKRIIEQAEEEGRSADEIAAERWGSLEKLESLLAEAESKARESRYVDHRATSQPRWKKAHQKDSYNEEKHNIRFDNFRRSRNESYNDCKKKFRRTDEDSDSYGNRYTPSKESKPYKSAPKWMKKEFHDKHQSVHSKESKKDMPSEERPKESPQLTEREERPKESPQLTEREERPKESPLLTEREMNQLGAKLLKAEMLGNKELAEELKLKLEEARKAIKNAPKINSDETVILLKTDTRGFTQPIAAPQTSYTSSKKKRQIDTYDASGMRTCYFPDDDKYSLKQMFEKEKKTTIDDQNAEFARLYAKQSKKDDDESFLIEASKIKPQVKQDNRERSQAIREHFVRSSALGKCQYCLDSSHMKRHLIVSLGKTVYLSLPSSQSLVDYHCYIVPMAHVTSGTLLDEDIWSEIQNFRKSLIRMFEDMDKTAVFLETSIHHRWQPHCFIECIPLPKEDGDMAPMYFKKAIMESETEWSLNKKLIDLYKKDLLHSVPRGLPYFSVEFGKSGGFAHVVEDEKLFPAYFGKEIIGGILDIEPVRWRKPPRDPFENQSKKVLDFTNIWKKYDWMQNK